MEKIYRQNLLYDFYGELLTEHQKNIYEKVIIDDMSYSEIAKEEEISRQGIYDMVKRCDKILEEYESKLLLVEKFLKTKDMVAKMNQAAIEISKVSKEASVEKPLREIMELSNAILEEY